MKSNAATNVLLVFTCLGCAAYGRSEEVTFMVGKKQLIMEVVIFKGGEFMMGCPSNPPPPWAPRRASQPEHKVVLSPFSMGKYPVSFEQYCHFLTAAGFQEEFTFEKRLFENIIVSDGTYRPQKGFEKCPAFGFTFQGATAFCHWFSDITGKKCRLPTEAEWEFVAKGKEGRTYPWGQQRMTKNVLGDPVGKSPELATPEGVHDMNGPAYQWCLDVFNPDFYSISPVTNPVCNQGNAQHVARGGPMIRNGLTMNVQLIFPATWERFSVENYPEKNRIPQGFRIVLEDSQN